MQVPFPAGEKPGVERVADWAEFQALTRKRSFKRGNLSAAISLEDVENPDLLEQQAWSTLAERAELFGGRWPLKLTGNWLSRRSPSPVDLNYYRYLLCLGMGQLDSEDRKLFELLATQAVSTMTGNVAVHVGDPASIGMDSSFRERMRHYAQLAGLVEHHELVSEPLPHDKDLGLDAVTWFSFEDNRSGEVQVLVQCATGADWDTKFHDLDLDVWKRHINWAVTPVRAFSVPFSITLPAEHWVRMCTKAGLILDRVRLTELVRRRPLQPTLALEVRSRLRVLTSP